MTSEELIAKIQEDAGEWLEMTPEPWKIIANSLASEVVQLKGYIEYLERRIENARGT